ncbi:unnamed protein product [Ambrosiozyma monospora]|uniref:Unnamed protein product n=1 Tax=Ambrosiozyma monospora TaxID=43982 RepID=A0A9W7DKB7_AMBMO|nr:unnamed protein product [Ambrosiozyma monospora]
MFPVSFICFFVYKYWKDTTWVKYEDMDLDSGRRLDLEDIAKQAKQEHQLEEKTFKAKAPADNAANRQRPSTPTRLPTSDEDFELLEDLLLVVLEPAVLTSLFKILEEYQGKPVTKDDNCEDRVESTALV